MSRRADDADAAAEAEAVHRGDHRHRAVVDRGEGVVAAAVHRRRSACRRARAPSRRRRRWKPRPSARISDARARRRRRPSPASSVGELAPAGAAERVHGRVVDHHLGDAARPPRTGSPSLPPLRPERLQRALGLFHDARHELGAARPVVDRARDRAARQVAVHRIALLHRAAREHRRVRGHQELRAREPLVPAHRERRAQQLARARRPWRGGRPARCGARTQCAAAGRARSSRSHELVHAPRAAGRPSISRVTITSSTPASR